MQRSNNSRSNGSRAGKSRSNRSRIGLLGTLMALVAQGFLANQVMGQRAPERMDKEVIGAFRWLDVEAGEQIRVYETGPENASSAVLLVHDWFGVSEMSIEAAERLGSMGYRVVAVDLYDGESATDHPGAGALMRGLVRERTNLILRTAATLASEGGRSVASLGFSMGGPEAVRSAVLAPAAITAVAVVYGGNIENVIQGLDTGLAQPLLLITGSDDGWPMTSIQVLQGEDAPQGLDLETYVYPGARHGYAQPLYQGGENLNPEATRLTWILVDDFLERHLR